MEKTITKEKLEEMLSANESKKAKIDAESSVLKQLIKDLDKEDKPAKE